MKRHVCLVSSGINSSNSRLQPWRYLIETCRGLAQYGHSVTLLTDLPRSREDGDTIQHILEHLGGPRDVPICMERLPSTGSRLGRGPVFRSLAHLKPDIVLWHVGLLSFLHQAFPSRSGSCSVGILTSPIYSFRELMTLGLGRLVGNPSLGLVPLLSSLTPAWLQRATMRRSGLSLMVTETATTARSLETRYRWNGSIRTILPGVDGAYLQDHGREGARLRKSLGYGPEETVLLYLGSPASLRGLRVLYEAFRMVSDSDPAVRLIVLSRVSEKMTIIGKRGQENAAQPMNSAIRLISGNLTAEQVILYISASDAVVLPFILVPSDAPLSVLEALALGKPVITTRLACLPELVEGGQAFLAEPGDAISLRDAILRAGKARASSKPPERPRTWEDAGQEWARLVEDL